MSSVRIHIEKGGLPGYSLKLSLQDRRDMLKFCN